MASSVEVVPGLGCTDQYPTLDPRRDISDLESWVSDSFIVRLAFEAAT